VFNWRQVTARCRGPAGTDDVAELVAWHHLTSRMGQTYRIVLRERDKDVFVYEPMASPLVQRRLRLLTSMYEQPPA
jgi:hypothetical protein